ncbi:hypothetical protein IK112_03265 [Candidatus Saccharibacteria bacterium]|nr:hypothetical protein [Candidatus Saccharibacteria bacterium]
MVSGRNRSSGWKHAKLSGHKNEDLVCDLLKTDKAAQNRLKKIAKIEDADFVDCDSGGLHEKHILSTLGGKTANKADITAKFTNGKKIGISLKKSLRGQVYLIKPETFIKGIETQYNTTIPENVKKAILLFWGPVPNIADITSKYSVNPKNTALELHKKSLTADTLKRYDESLYDVLIAWFKENIYIITDFCLSKGLALCPDDSATVIWYKNMLSENDIDDMYNISDLCKKAEAHKDTVAYGTRNGGTTITLPFGFVEWHQGCMQFHHKHESIAKL